MALAESELLPTKMGLYVAGSHSGTAAEDGLCLQGYLVIPELVHKGENIPGIPDLEMETKKKGELGGSPWGLCVIKHRHDVSV